MGTLIVDNIKKRDGSDGTDVGTGASITSPATNTLTLGTNDTERLRIASDGSIGTKGLIPSDGTFAANSTIRSQNSSGNISYIGFTQYTGDTSVGSMFSYMGGDGRSTGYLNFSTNDTERLRFAANGAIGLSGANYGNAGQVITSNGSGSAPTWQDAPSGITYGSVSNADIAVRARNGGADLGGHSSGTAQWVKMGTSCHIWGYVATSAGSNPNTDLAVLAFDDTNIPACTSTSGAPYGLCVGTVNFNAQGNFSNVVGAYAQARSTSYPREFQLFVETQAGASLETVTKFCAVEDIGTCAFNFDLWYQCAA